MSLAGQNSEKSDLAEDFRLKEQAFQMHKKALYQQLQEKNKRIGFLEKQSCIINEPIDGADHNDTQAKFEKLINQNELLLIENEDLQSKIKELEESNEMYINNYNQSSETIKAIEKNNLEINKINRDSIKSLEEVKRVYMEKYEKSERDKKSLEEVKNLFIEKFTKSLDTIKELEKDNKELQLKKPRIKYLELQLGKEQQKYHTLMEERDNYLNKIEEKEKFNKLIENQKKDLNEELETLKISTNQSILSLTEEIAKLQENILQASLSLESKIQECKEKDLQLEKVQENKVKDKKINYLIRTFKQKIDEGGKELKKCQGELAEQKEITNDVTLKICDLERKLKALKQDYQQVKTECTSWETLWRKEKDNAKIMKSELEYKNDSRQEKIGELLDVVICLKDTLDNMKIEVVRRRTPNLKDIERLESIQTNIQLLLPELKQLQSAKYEDELVEQLSQHYGFILMQCANYQLLINRFIARALGAKPKKLPNQRKKSKKQNKI